MRNAHWFLITKKIHRLLVVVILVTGICMIYTGLSMWSGTSFILDPQSVRYLHNKLSLLFTFILGAMMITGTYLFLFPYLPIKKFPPINDRTVN